MPFARIDYPQAHRALQVVRWRRDLGSGKPTIERMVTSPPPGTATGNASAAWIRGHWKTGNQLPHVRDRTLGEDASKIRTRYPPRVMAGPRDLTIGIHRQDGRTDITATLRRTGRNHQRPLSALGPA